MRVQPDVKIIFLTLCFERSIVGFLGKLDKAGAAPSAQTPNQAPPAIPLVSVAAEDRSKQSSLFERSLVPIVVFLSAARNLLIWNMFVVVKIAQSTAN
jgi:hypothetical protein